MGNDSSSSSQASVYEYTDPQYGRAFVLQNISITLPVSKNIGGISVSNPVLNVSNGKVRFGRFGDNDKYSIWIRIDGGSISSTYGSCQINHIDIFIRADGNGTDIWFDLVCSIIGDSKSFISANKDETTAIMKALYTAISPYCQECANLLYQHVNTSGYIFLAQLPPKRRIGASVPSYITGNLSFGMDALYRFK